MSDGARHITIAPAGTGPEDEMSLVEIIAAAMGMGTIELYALVVTVALLLLGGIALAMFVFGGDGIAEEGSGGIVRSVKDPREQQFQRGSKDPEPEVFRSIRRQREQRLSGGR
jgi:hypothetical protein